VTGPELKQLRQDLGDAIGRSLSAADMAKLCGLEGRDGADTIRRWEVTGPSGPAGKLLHILAMASDRHPILRQTDRPGAAVEGMVFAISGADLAAADEYEVDDYRRVAVPLRSGERAWVYVFGG